MYDPLETQRSMEYAGRIAERCPGTVMLGGWAVHLLVEAEYRRATGREYLRSRDIDLFVPRAQTRAFMSALRTLGFGPGAYPFRYTLRLHRDTGRRLSERAAAAIPLHDLVDIDVDVFTGRGGLRGAWRLDGATVRAFGFPGFFRLGPTAVRTAPPDTLLALKAAAYLQRETEDKRVKDACDLYALLRYGATAPTAGIREALRAMTASDHPRQVAYHLYQDEHAEGLVRRALGRWSQPGALPGPR